MINHGRLQELRDEIGVDDLAEVADMFLSEVGEVIFRICAAGDACVEDMHFLKGSAMNLGLESFGTLCGGAEGRMRGDPAYQPDLAALKLLFEQSRGALQAALQAG